MLLHTPSAEMAVQSDYMDLGLVDLKEIKMRNRDAVKMLFKMEIRQSTKDKISFTVSDITRILFIFISHFFQAILF